MFGEDGVREYLKSNGQKLYSDWSKGGGEVYDRLVKRKDTWMESKTKGAVIFKKLKLDEPEVILATAVGALGGELLASSLDYEASDPYSIAVPVIFAAGGAVAGYLSAISAIGLGQVAKSLIYGNDQKL